MDVAYIFNGYTRACMLGVFCVAQLEPDFEPAISDSSITVHVDELRYTAW